MKKCKGCGKFIVTDYAGHMLYCAACVSQFKHLFPTPKTEKNENE